MTHDTQIELITRALAHAAQRTCDPVGEVSRQDITQFTSAEHLERERQRIFRTLPLIVADSAALKQPGDYVSRVVLGTPVLTVRAKDGMARSFINVCRHRGSIVVDEGEGHARTSFKCPYHAWNYGLDGRLLHIPHGYGFPAELTDGTATRGLRPLATAEGLGFVWVRLSGDEPIDLVRYLGPLHDELAGFGIGDKFPEAPVVDRHYPMNWKIGVDSGLEVYHLTPTHKKTVGPFFHDNVGLFDRFYPHQRVLFPKLSLAKLADRDRSSWQLLDVANLVYQIFPNASILVQKDRVTRVSVFPLAAGESYYEQRSLLNRLPKTPEEERFVAENSTLITVTLQEDADRGRSIQSGLLSGANGHLTFGRFECGLTWFHEAVDDALAGRFDSRLAAAR